MHIKVLLINQKSSNNVLQPSKREERTSVIYMYFCVDPVFHWSDIVNKKKNDAKRGGWKKICTEMYDHIEEVDYRKTGEGVLTFCTQYKFKIPELKTQLKNTWAVFVFRTYHWNICKRFTEQSFQTGEPMYCRQPEVFRKSADIKTAKRLTAKQIWQNLF